MSDEHFTHDAAEFIPVATPSSIDVSDGEARYAALFAEVIWDGLITPEKRRQLRTAAELLGLSERRVLPIEQALLAAHEARHRVAVIEQDIDDAERTETKEARRSRKSLAPLLSVPDVRDSHDELRVAALVSRVDALEADNARLVVEGERAAQENERLAALVVALQAELASAPRSTGEAAADAGRLEPRGDAVGGQEPPPPEPRPSKSRSGGRASGPGRRHRSRRTITEAPPKGASAPPAAAPIPAMPPVPKLVASTLTVVPRNDPAELHRLLRKSPHDADLLRALFRSLQRADDLDRRFCIAHALVYLGEANDQERATFGVHAEEAVVRPSRGIEEEEWRDFLLHPDQDRMIGDALAEVAPAVLLGHVTALRASLVPDELDPARLVEPQSSTEPAVRCLGWAAAILGVKLPSLYAAPDIDRTADVVLTPKPATRLGSRMLTGRTPRELAFLAGQHLAWYRREHLLAQPSGSVRRLEDWVLAALLVASPELPLTPETHERVEPLAVTIRPLLGDAALGRLRKSLRRFFELGGRLNLARWLESVERTAACAGLLLANDLRSAASSLALDGMDSLDSMMGELIVFQTSKRCSVLRRRIGIAIGG